MAAEPRTPQQADVGTKTRSAGRVPPRISGRKGGSRVNIIFKGRRTDVQERFRRHASAKLARIEKLDRKAITIDPSLGDAYVMLANNLITLGHHAEAIAAAEKALFVSPNQADTLLLAAWAFAPNGRANEAVDLAQRALRLNPYPPDWYYGALGDSLLFARRVDEALPALSKCVEPTSQAALGQANFFLQ